MKSIILLGYMCAGKTTVGRAVAKKLGCTFYDLDWYIEERFHTKVARIFAEEGEARFRDLERRMLHAAAEFENVVLACGGGTPCFFDNMDYMNSVGHTFYMKASVQTLCDHIGMSRGERPLLKGKSSEELKEFVAAQLAEREPFYSQAQEIIDVNVLDSFDKIDHVADLICERL